MNLKTTPIFASREQTSESMTTILHGKRYRICSSGQMHYVEEDLKGKLLKKSSDEGLELTPEQVAEGVERLKEDCGYATVGWILGRLSPEQQTEWKNQYRFGGTWRKKRVDTV